MQRCKEYRRRVGKGFLTHGLCQEGWERDFPPTGATHGGISHPRLCQEGWERDFPPTGAHPWGDFSPTVCVKKGGKGISHPRGPPMGDFSPTVCVKKGGKGISHPRGPPMGGFLTHGVCQEGWERDFPPTGATRGGISHPQAGGAYCGLFGLLLPRCPFLPSRPSLRPRVRRLLNPLNPPSLLTTPAMVSWASWRTVRSSISSFPSVSDVVFCSFRLALRAWRVDLTCASSLPSTAVRRASANGRNVWGCCIRCCRMALIFGTRIADSSSERFRFLDSAFGLALDHLFGIELRPAAPSAFPAILLLAGGTVGTCLLLGGDEICTCQHETDSAYGYK